jgi:hypothetical protein
MMPALRVCSGVDQLLSSAVVAAMGEANFAVANLQTIQGCDFPLYAPLCRPVLSVNSPGRIAEEIF